jgi:hypothetical protein
VGWAPFSSEFVLSTDPQPPLPRLGIVACFLGLACGCATSAWATRHSGRLRARLLLLLSGGVGAAVAAQTVIDARQLEGRRSLALFFPHAHAHILIPLGWAGLACAGLMILAPRSVVLRNGRLACTLAAAPPLLALLAYLLSTRVQLTHAPIGRAAVILHPTFPRTAGGVMLDSGIGVALSLGTAISVLFLWQLIEAAHVARDTATVAASYAARLPALLGAAIALKVVWITLGYLDVLPHALGGGSAWHASRHDGVVAWTLALLWAAAAGVWLRRPRLHSVSVKQLERGVIVVVVSLSAFVTAAAALLLAHPVLRVLPGHPLAARDLSLENWLGDHIQWSFVSTPAAALIIGPLLATHRRLRTLGVFLALFGAWSAVRALEIGHALLQQRGLAAPLVRALDGNVMPTSTVGTVDFVTLDSAITAMLVVLLVLAWQRRAEISRAGIAFVLVASTLAAYSGFLANIFQSHWTALFYVGLVFPVAYMFLADAQEVNESPQRPLLLLTLVMLSLLLLTAALALILEGELTSNSTTTGALGRVLFGPPLIALLIAATLTPVKRPERSASA